MTKHNHRAERDLPYAIAKSAIPELISLLQDRDNLDEFQLDLAWLGLERPNPEPRRSETHIVVWVTKTQSEALRALIDGHEVNTRACDAALVKLQNLFAVR